MSRMKWLHYHDYRIEGFTLTHKLRRNRYQMPRFMPLSARIFSQACRYVSVSVQDSPFILDAPQLPAYRVSSPTNHPEDESPQSIPVIINRDKPQPQMKNFSNGTNSRSQDSRVDISSTKEQSPVSRRVHHQER